MKTDLQLRVERLSEIHRICELEGEEHRVTRSQLDSLSNLGIEVTHRLVVRARNDLIEYWRQRAESAEMFISGETQRSTN